MEKRARFAFDKEKAKIIKKNKKNKKSSENRFVVNTKKNFE